MFETYHDYWDTLRKSWPFRVALVFSVIAHAGASMLLAQALRQPVLKPIPITYEVQFIAPPTPEPEEKVEAPPPPKPPPPKPKPKPPPPKPKEEPKVAKKVDPPKPKPKPKPKEPEKVVEKKPEPKPPPKKEPKEEPKKPPPEKPKPQSEVVAKAPPPKKGVQQEQLPTMLNAWGRAVQRKVEKYWRVPGGVKLTEENREVHISFWVDRDGNLLGRPKIIKEAEDPALGESGIRSLLMAEPLPPLPNEYREQKQQVIYVFSVAQ